MMSVLSNRLLRLRAAETLWHKVGKVLGCSTFISQFTMHCNYVGGIPVGLEIYYHS